MRIGPDEKYERPCEFPGCELIAAARLGSKWFCQRHSEEVRQKALELIEIAEAME